MGGGRRCVLNCSLTDDGTDRDLRDLMQEMEIMKHFGSHVNLVNLVGCCT